MIRGGHMQMLAPPTLVVEKGEEEMFERGIFVPAAACFGEGVVERLFQLAEQDQHSCRGGVREDRPLDQPRHLAPEHDVSTGGAYEVVRDPAGAVPYAARAVLVEPAMVNAPSSRTRASSSRP